MKARSLSLVAVLALSLGGFAGGAACSDDSESEPEDKPEAKEVILADPPPPPISGGTLLVAEDERTAVAADPDRDLVWIVDTVARRVLGQVALQPDDEPGRIVAGDAGRVHVALRKGGAIATVDLATASLVARYPVCPAPRGLAFDGETGSLHVACVDGDLVSLDAATGAELRRLPLERDLRDVVIDGPRLFVSRFRSSEVLVVEGDEVVRRLLPATAQQGPDIFEPAVAWRMMPMPGGGVAVLHQRGKATPIEIKPGAYASGACSGAVVHGTVTLLDEDTLDGVVPPVVGSYLPRAVLPVDGALSADGQTFVTISAGTREIMRLQTKFFSSTLICGPGGYEGALKRGLETILGQPIAVAFAGEDRFVVQTREPAGIIVLPLEKVDDSVVAPIELGGASRFDTGHHFFHLGAESSLLSCASCHVEGGDDGRTWNFIPDGLRRTQNLRGGITASAPFHWKGDLDDMQVLLDDTFTARMGGVEMSEDEKSAVARWIDSIPLLPRAAPSDPAAVERGRLLFEGPALCSSCHEGPTYTNHKNESVGVGEELQTPALLGLWARGPFMHDGCAPTIRDRFTPCGGPAHGATGALSSVQLDDLVAFLESL